MNGLFFGPGPNISLRPTPHALSTLVTVLARVASGAMGCWAVGRR